MRRNYSVIAVILSLAFFALTPVSAYATTSEELEEAQKKTEELQENQKKLEEEEKALKKQE